MINTQTLKGNLVNQDYSTAFTLSQGDKGVPFRVELLENGTPYTLLSDDIVTIEWLKPNGNPFLQEGNIKYGTNYIEFTTPESVAQYSGSGTFNIIISNNNVRKGTIRREYKVIPTSLKPGSVSEDVITDAITELRELSVEIADTVQNNQDLINNNQAATKQDIANVNSSLEDIMNKQIKYFIPSMSKPVDTAGINSSGVISWIKDKTNLKTYIENIKNMGFNEVYLIINSGFISSTEFIIAYNSTDFTNWQDSFTYFLSLLEQNNIKLLGIKLHTTGGYGCVTLEQINNTGGMTLFKTKYKEMVTNLCSFFKDYTDRAILFNEIDWMYLDSAYDDFITECFAIVKNKGMKCSISTINPSHYISISDAVKTNMDFYATNYYPPISDNALDVDLSSMVQKVVMADDYKKGLRYMLRSKKDVFISETGCMDKYDSLCEPWKWQNFIDTASGHNGEVQYMFLQVILNVFNENRIKNVCYWFDLDSSLDWFIKKINGGDQ